MAKHGVSNVKDHVLTQLHRIAHAPKAAAYADAVGGAFNVQRAVEQSQASAAVVCSSCLRRNGSHSIRWAPFFIVSLGNIQ